MPPVIIISRLKSILDKYINQPVRLPAKTMARFTESPTCAPYLVSCFDQPVLLYLSDRFESLTGYPGSRFQTEGLPFWFSVIHPADVQGVVNSITKAQYQLAVDATPPTEPLQLEYRVKRADGRWLWIRELKCIVSYRQGKKDHILGCFQDISAEKDAEIAVVRDVLEQERDINGLLDVAMSYQTDRESIDTRLTAREKEVLKLVATGNSTKQIAAQLSISENTVETHRRHLLEKFGVNNSTALIQAAHRLALL